MSGLRLKHPALKVKTTDALTCRALAAAGVETAYELARADDGCLASIRADAEKSSSGDGTNGPRELQKLQEESKASQMQRAALEELRLAKLDAEEGGRVSSRGSRRKAANDPDPAGRNERVAELRPRPKLWPSPWCRHERGRA